MMLFRPLQDNPSRSVCPLLRCGRWFLIRLFTSRRDVAGIRHSSRHPELGQYPLHHNQVEQQKTYEADPFRHYRTSPEPLTVKTGHWEWRTARKVVVPSTMPSKNRRRGAPITRRSNASSDARATISSAGSPCRTNSLMLQRCRASAGIQLHRSGTDRAAPPSWTETAVISALKQAPRPAARRKALRDASV